MAEDARARWVAEGVALLLLAFCIVLLVTNILPTRASLAELEREEAELVRENEELQRQCEFLELKARALKVDPQTKEGAFRSTYRTGPPGEKTYHFEGD